MVKSTPEDPTHLTWKYGLALPVNPVTVIVKSTDPPSSMVAAVAGAVIAYDIPCSASPRVPPIPLSLNRISPISTKSPKFLFVILPSLSKSSVTVVS